MNISLFIIYSCIYEYNVTINSINCIIRKNNFFHQWKHQRKHQKSIDHFLFEHCSIIRSIFYNFFFREFFRNFFSYGNNVFSTFIYSIRFSVSTLLFLFRDKKRFYIFIFHLFYTLLSFSLLFFSFVILTRLFCFFHDSFTIFRIGFVYHINACFAFFMFESWRFFDFAISILICQKKNLQTFQSFFFSKYLYLYFS